MGERRNISCAQNMLVYLLLRKASRYSRGVSPRIIYGSLIRDHVEKPEALRFKFCFGIDLWIPLALIGSLKKIEIDE